MVVLLAGLAWVAAVLASVLTGMRTALSARSQWSEMPERARRFVRTKDPSAEADPRYALAVRGGARERRVDQS